MDRQREPASVGATHSSKEVQGQAPKSSMSFPYNPSFYASPYLHVYFTDEMTEVDPGFWTATLAARDQFGTDVTDATVAVRYLAGSPFAPGTQVTLPEGFKASLTGKIQTPINFGLLNPKKIQTPINFGLLNPKNIRSNTNNSSLKGMG